MTAWLFEPAEKHMSKHSSVYCSYQMDIGYEFFKRAFVTHPNTVFIAGEKNVEKG